MSCKLLLATNNQGKVREFRYLLRQTALDIVSLKEAGLSTVLEETGATFKENAHIKATLAARDSGFLTLADDSGLEVDALNGEPGIRSARYAGPDASDAERVQYLLGKLKGVPAEKRTARFVCVIAIATPAGEVAYSEGECRGLIAFEPRGDHGFGYDPVFLFPELGRTMAELPEDLKNRISHRARAAAGVPSILARRPFACVPKERPKR